MHLLKSRRRAKGRPRACLLLACMAAASGMSAHAQETATLHVSTRVVEVSAVVTDKQGAPKTGLTKDDFTLKQDGKEQPIRYFSEGNESPLTFVVMIDTSGSQRTFIDDEQRACDIFFETVLGRAEDRAALVEVNAKITPHSELTSDPARLHLALTGLHFNQADAVATRINDAVYSVSKGVLASVRGRKAIILISDGGEQGSAIRREEAVAEAQRDNVPVYGISYSAWTGMSRGPGTAGGDQGLANLKQWAVATGGHVYEVAHGTTLRHIFEDIATELRSQYEIGYTLPQETQPGTFHKIELHPKDKALRVQARTGFMARP